MEPWPRRPAGLVRLLALPGIGRAYLYNHIRLPDRDQAFHTHPFRLRIGTALDTRLSVNAFLQYNSAVDLISTNVRFRYTIRDAMIFESSIARPSTMTVTGCGCRCRTHERFFVKYTRTLLF